MTTLRSIREKKGLSLPQLAARASIPARIIADYEEGRLAMPLNHARLIAKALWVPIEDLMPPGSMTTPAPSSPTPQPQPRPQQAPTQQTDTAGYRQQTATAPRPETPAQVPDQQPPRPAQPGGYQAPPQPSSPPREQRPQAGQEGGRPRGVQGGRGAPGEGRQNRPTKTLPHPPGPISEGQLQELSRLAVRLEIDQEQMEARIGKPLGSLTRPDARDWIKKLRAIADEIAPSQKVHYGVWPEAQEDREAAYLRQQRDANACFTFKLFNGEEFAGTLVDFTPYTITVKPEGSDDEVVLRKLAIAYYRRTGTAATEAGGLVPSAEVGDALLVPAGAVASTQDHNHARDDPNQPLDEGLASDRTGEPEAPEEDNMDEDRGI